jgi:hypothetical protein
MDFIGTAIDRAGDTRQHCVPLVRFEHVADPFVGTDCKRDISIAISVLG